ncbi:MAG TPA: response regulator [Pyrinomonadaceae bacterium]|nr:response regulator [Pyrinomonadaceae bacterium]
MSKRKLLLADDSVTIQKVVNLTFADEGIEVITVGDGDSAMQKIGEVSPDVVLADVHMPGLNGYQICEIVRGNPATRDLPVVLLVGSFEPFDEAEAGRVGANGYLTKPFQSIRQLVAQVSDLIEKPDDASMATTDPDLEIESAAAAGAGEQTTGKAPDTGDIDSLYNRSLSEPQAESTDVEENYPQPGESYSSVSEQGSSEAAVVSYLDAGMDDEMIETHRADEISTDQSTESASYETVEEFQPASDISDFEPVSNGEVEYTAPGSEANDGEAEGTGASPFDTFATTHNKPDQTTERQGDATDFDRFAATERIPVSQHRDVGGYKLDEIELLELPPLDNGATLEFTTTQGMMAQGGNKQVVSLSPELMDAIVQKVVEKLSEKY